ncbi:MAG: DUF433 domain-containing protein [Anaerolineae bacterium]|nr:DUF433 domain-containing protein [Anaerolineae bacterium]
MNNTTVLTIDYIVRTPGICGGVPRIDGTRIAVDWIVGQMIYAGRDVDEIVEDYAHVPLTSAQIHAALAYYYDHQEEIDGLIAESEQLLDKVKRRDSRSTRADYITAKEAAALLGIDHESHQIAKLCRQGVLTGRKIANRWMISRDSLEMYQRGYRKPGPRPSSAARP